MFRKADWRIYYADGSTFDSVDGEPWQAPATRVVLIIQRHRDPQEHAFFQWMKDYYIYKHNRWFVVDYGALLFYWFTEQYDHPRASLAGETIPNETWNEMGELARRDRDSFRDAI